MVQDHISRGKLKNAATATSYKPAIEHTSHICVSKLKQGLCGYGKPGQVMVFEWLIPVMEIFRKVKSHGKWIP